MFEGGADKGKKRKLSDDPHGLDGYKGNFNKEKFNVWFREVCKTCQAQHGACDIKMDAASYHRENIHKMPNPATKAQYKAWLGKYNVEYDEGALNATLLDLIKRNRPDPEYESVNIAKEYGHTVIFTPPYHPELQEIEVVWAVAKNYCKGKPAQSWKDLLKNANYAPREHVTSKTWAAVHKKVIEWEDFYLEGLGADVEVFDEAEVDEEHVDPGQESDADDDDED